MLFQTKAVARNGPSIYKDLKECRSAGRIEYWEVEKLILDCYFMEKSQSTIQKLRISRNHKRYTRFFVNPPNEDGFMYCMVYARETRVETRYYDLNQGTERLIKIPKAEIDFMREIWKDPEPLSAPRLVFADWCEESGDPRCEWIRHPEKHPLTK